MLTQKNVQRKSKEKLSWWVCHSAMVINDEETSHKIIAIHTANIGSIPGIVASANKPPYIYSWEYNVRQMYYLFLAFIYLWFRQSQVKIMRWATSSVRSEGSGLKTIVKSMNGWLHDLENQRGLRVHQYLQMIGKWIRLETKSVRSDLILQTKMA